MASGHLSTDHMASGAKTAKSTKTMAKPKATPARGATSSSAHRERV
jgi:hypothetical protein